MPAMPGTSFGGRGTRPGPKGPRKRQPRHRIPIGARFRVTSAVDIFTQAERANIEALKDAGSYIRRVAKSLGGRTRRKQRSADPDMPWKSQTGALRRTINYGLDRNRMSVVIGPSRFHGTRTAPRALEYGGQSIAIQTIVPLEEAERRRQRKESRRRRGGKKKRQRTQAEVRRIQQWYAENPRPKGIKKRYMVHIKPRPTMHIAAGRSQKYIADAWQYLTTSAMRRRRYFGSRGINWKQLMQFWRRN